MTVRLAAPEDVAVKAPRLGGISYGISGRGYFKEGCRGAVGSWREDSTRRPQVVPLNVCRWAGLFLGEAFCARCEAVGCCV